MNEVKTAKHFLDEDIDFSINNPKKIRKKTLWSLIIRFYKNFRLVKLIVSLKNKCKKLYQIEKKKF
jgi:hypothetical protein